MAKTLRAPSYKAIALAILRNNVHEIGYAHGQSVLTKTLESIASDQKDLFIS